MMKHISKIFFKGNEKINVFYGKTTVALRCRPVGPPYKTILNKVKQFEKYKSKRKNTNAFPSSD